jgi:hypothetical protein
MKVERFTVQACCGRTSIIFKTDQPISKIHLEGLVSRGFNEHGHFTQAGILYADNSDFIVTGPIGSDRLQVKCKTADCEKRLNDLEALLLQLG